MYDPNNPVQGGDFQITSMLGAGPKPANSYAIQQGMNALNGGPPGMHMAGRNQGAEPWRDAWKQAQTDWRMQRPELAPGMSDMDWRNALMGWRGLKPDKMTFRNAPQPVPAAAPPMTAPPQTIPTPPPNYQLPVYQYGG